MRYLLSRSFRQSSYMLLSLSLCFGISMAKDQESTLRERHHAAQTHVQQQIADHNQIAAQPQNPQQSHSWLRKGARVMKATNITANTIAMLILGYEMYKTYNLTINDFQFEYKKVCLNGMDCVIYKGSTQSPVLGYEESVSGYRYCAERNTILPQSAIEDDLYNRVACLLMGDLTNRIILMDIRLITIFFCLINISCLLP